MNKPAKIIESPRDAWQGLARPLPTEIKADYLRALVAAGFRHIDAVDFGPATPTLKSDSELVLEYLDLPGLEASIDVDPEQGSGTDGDDHVEILALVSTAAAVQQAAATGKVHAVEFVYSVSETFLRRAQAHTAEEVLETLEEVGSAAQMAATTLVGVCAMAWGNPFGDLWSVDETVAACELMAESGAGVVVLADTSAAATAPQVADLFRAVHAAVGTGRGAVEVGIHLHTRPDQAAAKVRAAYEAGCRRFDACIGGLGGSAFAQDILAGNLATETLLLELARMGADLPPMRPLDSLARAGQELARKYGGMVQ